MSSCPPREASCEAHPFTTKRLTMQETFDIICDHLMKQNARSVKLIDFEGMRTHRCLYRHGSLRCAVGVLIPDHLYEPKMEFKGVNELCQMFPEVFEHLPPISESLSLLEACQRLHDFNEPNVWAERLRAVAHDRCLSAPASISPQHALV